MELRRIVFTTAACRYLRNMQPRESERENEAWLCGLMKVLCQNGAFVRVALPVVFNILAWVPPASPRVLPLSTSAYLVSHHFNESPVSCLSPFEAVLPQPYAYGCTAAPQQCLFTVDQALQTVQIYFPNFRTILFFSIHPTNQIILVVCVAAWFFNLISECFTWWDGLCTVTVNSIWMIRIKIKWRSGRLDPPVLRLYMPD